MKFQEDKKQIHDKWLIIPAILLVLNFIYRLINQSKIISIFPLDYTNDISSYMVQLFFLAKCGFHKFCPYWYGGFITFNEIAPGWYFFTYPIYLLTNNVQLSTYLSMIIIFILIFIAMYFFGRLNKFSNIKVTAFFLFLFANAVAIGNFIRLGRPHELLAWLYFIIIAFTCLLYKRKKIANKFYYIIIPLSLVILTHQVITLLSFVVLFSLFITKKRFKERLKIILVSIISLILTSFWLVPFLLNFTKSNVHNLIPTQTLFSFNKLWFWQNIATFIVPVIFCTIFYFYWLSKNKSKKELLFFITPVIIALLLFFRLIYFMPILKYVYPDSFIHMFLFFSIFMLFKLDINILSNYIKKLIPIILILVVIISICFNIFYTPFFITHSNLEKDTLDILNKTDGKFLILNSPSTTSYSRAYYCYAPIYLNLTTSDGWHKAIVSRKNLDIIEEIGILLKNKECTKLNKNLNYLNTTNVITYNQHCSYLKDCNLREIYKKNNVCLFTVKK